MSVVHPRVRVDDEDAVRGVLHDRLQPVAALLGHLLQSERVRDPPARSRAKIASSPAIGNTRGGAPDARAGQRGEEADGARQKSTRYTHAKPRSSARGSMPRPTAHPQRRDRQVAAIIATSANRHTVGGVHTPPDSRRDDHERRARARTTVRDRRHNRCGGAWRRTTRATAPEVRERGSPTAPGRETAEQHRHEHELNRAGVPSPTSNWICTSTAHSATVSAPSAHPRARRPQHAQHDVGGDEDAHGSSVSSSRRSARRARGHGLARCGRVFRESSSRRSPFPGIGGHRGVERPVSVRT